MALSSLPFWQRADPLSVLALSRKDRKKREEELLDAERIEDRGPGGVGRMVEPTQTPDPDPTPEDEDEDEDREA
jgi:hypothetical protein